MNIADSVLELIGRTPLVRLHLDEERRAATVLAKLERANPMGSAKDRVALGMIEDAETRGLLAPGSVVIEPTSGNTGLALAMVCAVRGYRLILSMPESMSLERRLMLAALGAEVILTPAERGMRGAIDKADELAKSIAHSFSPNQFGNEANPRSHERTTAREIWDDTDGTVDAVVGGIGTGGTLTGIARFLGDRKPEVEIIGVEPSASPFLTEGHSGPHRIQGIGAGFRPEILEPERLTRVLTVTDDEAVDWMRRLARSEGIFCGPSSGAAVAAALRVAREPSFAGRTIVVILPDGGEKYLSTSAWGGSDAS